MNLRYRIHQWMADRVNFIQYPDVRRISDKQKWRPFESSPFIQVDETSGKARLSYAAQLTIFLYSMILMAIGLVILGVGVIVLWAVFSSFF